MDPTKSGNSEGLAVGELEATEMLLLIWKKQTAMVLQLQRNDFF